jgi:penicillin-binding protein 1A
MRPKGIIFLGVAAFFAGSSGVAAGLIHLYLSDLPQIRYLEEYRPSAVTLIYDSRGRLIGELYQEKREPVPLSRISPMLVEATLAVEDERFYRHVGVDIKGIARAFWANVKHQGLVQGGSTITQQLTRGLFLTTEKTMSRKIKEAVLAVQIENRYSKEEILELYFNQIYLGGGVYGVEAAARKYFDRGASDLDLSQAAMIAGLPRAPAYYDPLRFPKRARQRRATVLRRMMELEIITPRQFQEANIAPLGLVPQTADNLAPYFVEHVRQYLEERYGYTAVYQKGLEVYTTLDLDLQSAARQAVRKGLERLDREAGWRRGEAALPAVEAGDVVPGLEDLHQGMVITGEVVEVGKRIMTLKVDSWLGTVSADSQRWPHLEDFSGIFKTGQWVRARVENEPPLHEPVALLLDQEPLIQGAMIAVNPRNGHIMAMIGGYDFTASQFNRSVQARRQPGSAIKPLVYAAAVESGLTPADLILDAPIRYWDSVKKVYWEPRNFSGKFYGETTLLEGLTHSRNVVTIKLLSHLGVGKAIRFIRRLGIESPMEPNLSLALGTSEVSLLELTSAYSVFANGGIRAVPMFISRISDDQGRVLENHQPVYQKVLDPEISFVTLDMMRSVVNHGTGRIARSLGMAVAAKTGTTNNYQDTWFVGFTPAVAVGVWVGYDDNRTIGRGGTGARVAGPIWVDFLEGVRSFLHSGEFHPPEDVVFRQIDPGTGLLIGGDCPDWRLVAFVRGTEPRETCIHELEAVPQRLRFEYD